jgi:uncharacterized protein YhfF
MDLPTSIRPFWNAFEATVDFDASTRFYEVFFFADTEAVANELAALVLCGTKQATASLLWTYEAEGQALPRPGNLSVMTDWGGHPLCIIETMEVELVPFDEVSPEFAATEGEGDKSLRYWREVHWNYFSRECEAIARQAESTMPVVCERFNVIYRASDKPTL